MMDVSDGQELCFFAATLATATPITERTVSFMIAIEAHESQN